MTLTHEQIQALRAKYVDRIIAEIKAKHSHYDAYVPVMTWGEFCTISTERDADKALIAELKPIAAHAQRGWQEAHEQEALVEQAMTRIDEQAKRIAELEQSEHQLIGERDDAEDALANMYQAATGERPEWSDWFSFADAVDAVEQRLGELEARTLTVKLPDAISLEQQEYLAEIRESLSEQGITLVVGGE